MRSRTTARSTRIAVAMVAGAAAGWCLVACLDVDRLTAGKMPAGRDAEAPVEAAPAAEIGAADGGTDGGPRLGVELVDNGGFESGDAGCGAPWESNGPISKAPGRTGTSACYGCGGFEGFRLAYGAEMGSVPTLGAVYRARAWVRGEPDAGPYTTHLVLRTFNAEGQARQEVYSPARALTAEWQPIDLLLDVYIRAVRIEISVSALGGSFGTCAFVDDVSLVRSQ